VPRPAPVRGFGVATGLFHSSQPNHIRYLVFLRYSAEAGLRNIMIAEAEVVLTYLLEVMAEHGILDKLAFKGGTCLCRD